MTPAPTDAQRPHVEEFMAAFRGVPVHIVCKLLRMHGHGDWRGINKGEIAYYYAEAKAPRHEGVAFAPNLKHLRLAKLAELAKGDLQDMSNWRDRRA